MPKIIAISGKAQHGKDTFASMLYSSLVSYNKNPIILHFGDILKFICSKYYGWNGKKDDWGRELLQMVGTDIFRKNNPDCWCNILSEIIKGMGDEYSHYIIADVRFKNEIECLAKLGNSFSVRVNRPNFDNGLTDEQKVHPSETDLDGYIFDAAIQNDGSLDELEGLAEIVASRLI